jgi:hypothetical protein
MQRMKRRWPWLLMGQAAIVAAVTALAVAALLADPAAAGPLYAILMWGIAPLSGAVTAYFLVRFGVNAFGAFWLPPLTVTAVHWLIAGLPPLSFGMTLTAALLAIVGAAAGEESLKRRKKKRAGQKKK